MNKYNFNVFKKRNPWTPAIYFLLGYPFILIMSLITTSFAFNNSILITILLSIITFIGGLFLFLYALNRIYEINLELIKIDSDAPSKNSWFIAILLSFLIIGIPYFWYLEYKFSKSLEKISNNEISSIITFLLLLFLFPVGVSYSQYKINNLPRTKENQNISDTNINSNEENARQYIEQYKSRYSKEQIRKGLIENGLSNSEIEKYLNKYF